MDDARRLQRIGERAAAEVPDGALVGLGTGSTADAMLTALGARVQDGLTITGVATSESTMARARDLGIRLVALDDVDQLDLCIDGADEIDPRLDLVKGRGGALLHEKLVAGRASRLIIIASSEKLVDRLGTRLPVPVEVVPFGHTHTRRALAELELNPTLRPGKNGSPFMTDGGHLIYDCDTGPIEDAAALASVIKAITGVVEHGLFVGMASFALTVDADGAITTHAAGG